MLKPSFSSFINLIYPEACASCGTHLLKDEEILCLSCQYDLPQTQYHLIDDNPLYKKLKPFYPIQKAVALYHYSKGGGVQNIIQELKYRNKPKVATYLGEQYSNWLTETDFFEDIDLIIPVPINYWKGLKRGYNQAEEIAKGIQKATAIPCDTQYLQKKRVASQTEKARFSRFQNMEESILLKKPLEENIHHVLIVDDVITTGATLKACMKALSPNQELRISVLSLATRQEQ